METQSTPVVPAFRSTPRSAAFLAKARREHRLGAPVSEVKDPEALRQRVLSLADWLNANGTPGDTWSADFVRAERDIAEEAFCYGACLAEQEEWKAALRYAVIWTPGWDCPLGPDGLYDQGARLLK